MSVTRGKGNLGLGFLGPVADPEAKGPRDRDWKAGKTVDVYIRSTPHPVTVTTRIITFLVGNPYKPSFATVTGRGVVPMYTNGALNYELL